MTNKVIMSVQCNQCMWIGGEDDLLWDGDVCIRCCPACNANDETLMDLTEASSPYSALKDLARLAISPPHSGDARLAIRVAEGAISDFHKSATPIAVLTLIEDRDQQYEMKVKAREQRDSATAKMKAAQAENFRLIRIIIGADNDWQIVPVEPTIEMIAALGFAGDIDLSIGCAAVSENISKAYKQALLSAPKKAIKHDQD